MENEKELIMKLNEELQKQFNGNAEFDRIRDKESFSFCLRENDKFPVYQVKYTEDKSGIHIIWANAWIIDPYRFNPPESKEGVSMGGE